MLINVFNLGRSYMKYISDFEGIDCSTFELKKYMLKLKLRLLDVPHVCPVLRNLRILSVVCAVALISGM